VKEFNNPPWHPITNPVDLKHLGKLGEEVNELGRIVNRTIIQGMVGIDPATGEYNFDAMCKEMADVIANIELCCERWAILSIDRERVERKKAQQRIWHADA
jgi:NTP pyrophosphatase (non-canonical NTP hydrolase)